MNKMLVLLILLVALGCSSDEESLYEGLTLKAWAERLDSPDPAVKLDALKVIRTIGVKARPAEEHIRNIAREDSDHEVALAAIEALEAMGAPVIEFGEFLDLYYAPVIPDEEIEIIEEENGEDAEEMSEFMEHASVAADIEYLQRLNLGDLDLDQPDTSQIPTDPEQFETWKQMKRSSSISDLLDLLNSPEVLNELLKNGGKLEQEFAVRKLATLSGSNPEILNSLLGLTSVTDSSLQQAVSTALNNWK